MEEGAPLVTQTLLRRTAESLYWAGRHLERAEDMARIVLVHGNTHVDLPVGEDVGWAPLLAVAGVEGDFAECHPAIVRARQDAPNPTEAPEAEVVEFLLCAPANPNSVLATVGNVREGLRSARTAVPREAWELTNGLWLSLREHRRAVWWRDGRVRWLRRTIGDCERINGALWGTMRRDSAMALTRIGQHLERADLTCRFLSVRADSALADASGDADPYDHVRAMSVLKSLAAHQQYRRAMPARPGSDSVVEFLLQDEALPRTVASCLAQVRQYLKELPHNQEALEACTDASVFVTGSVITGFTPVGLQQYLETLGGLIANVHDRIEAALFSEAPIEASSEIAEPRRPTRTLTRTAVQSRPIAPAVIRRYRVVHQTRYHYDDPAEESHNEIHMRPRNTVHQRVLSNTIDVVPTPETRSDLIDQLGNHVTTFVVRGHFDELSVTSTSEVELFAISDPPTGPPWESVCLTLDRDRRLGTRSAAVFRSPSRLVPTAPVLATYAAESFGHHRPVVEAVRELCSRIHRDFAYQPGFTSVTTPLLDVFEARRGVCQDFAHLAVGCLRSMGLAARYVSGYIETVRPYGDQLTGADASHAWASTYLPGWGWLDIDPTNNVMVCEDHVTTAWGRDYQDVSPLRGSVAGGGRSHTLEVDVKVTRLDGAS
jgi:transglutaminase-like putative cysteine protease/uncharacterized alpha-E superfamily protein